MATDDDASEAVFNEWRPSSPPPLPAGGPLGNTAVTRALTPEEEQPLAQARTARGEDPYPTITPEHRARLEADRARAIRDRVLVPAGAPEWLGRALRASPLPAGARTQCEVSPSGAVNLVIRHGEHVVAVHGSADRRRWGYSLDPLVGEGLAGHDEVAPLLPVALHAVAALLGGCDPPPSPVRLPVRPGVAGVLDALHEQRITLRAAAADFAARDWSMPYMAMFKQEEPARANYWEDVEAARQTGRITREQYRVLDDARGVVTWHRAPDEARWCSEPLQLPTVSQLLRQLEDGSLSLADLAAEFSRRDWTIPAMSVEAIQRGDEDPPRANDWRDVESARRDRQITLDQYQALKAARGPMLARTEPT